MQTYRYLMAEPIIVKCFFKRYQLQLNWLYIVPYFVLNKFTVLGSNWVAILNSRLETIKSTIL